MLIESRRSIDAFVNVNAGLFVSGLKILLLQMCIKIIAIGKTQHVAMFKRCFPQMCQEHLENMCLLLVTKMLTCGVMLLQADQSLEP